MKTLEPGAPKVAAKKPPFDLRELIADELETSTSPDPKVVAAAVIRKLTPTECRAALSSCLWLYVRSIDHAPSNAADVDDPDHDGVDAQKGVVGVVNNRAARTGRRLIERFLSGRVPGVDGYKFVRDFTADDALHAAEVRAQHALANAAAADQFRRLAEAIKEHGVDTVGDLPADVLDEVLA